MESKLNFVPIIDPALVGFIPWTWLEQIKNRKWATEWFYRIAPSMLMTAGNLMWYVADEERHYKGFLWAKIDMLSGELTVIVYSIDRHQQADYDFENTQAFLARVIEDYNRTCADYLMELKEEIHWPGTHQAEEPFQPDKVEESEDK